jgi:polyribonucleotide nucleotidyltransferase
MVVGFDDRGKIKLSMKRVNQETGEAVPQKPKEDRGERETA